MIIIQLNLYVNSGVDPTKLFFFANEEFLRFLLGFVLQQNAVDGSLLQKIATKAFLIGHALVRHSLHKVTFGPYDAFHSRNAAWKCSLKAVW